jgi:hypothetical protein
MPEEIGIDNIKKISGLKVTIGADRVRECRVFGAEVAKRKTPFYSYMRNQPDPNSNASDHMIGKMGIGSIRFTYMTATFKKRANIPTEHEEQVGFISWWRLRFPGVLIFSIPNGEHRHISVAKRLKDEGLTPGMPDLYCPKYKLWIELKRSRGGKISQEQERIIEYLRMIGDTVIIAMGAEDASRQVLAILKDRCG